MSFLVPVVTDSCALTDVPNYFEFDEKGVPRDLFEVGTEHVLTDTLQRNWRINVGNVVVAEDPQGEEGACMATVHCEGKIDSVPLSRGSTAATVSLCRLNLRIPVRTLLSELPPSLQPSV